MININTYILEKLHLNKDMEIKTSIDSIDKVRDIIISVFLFVLITKSYKENSVFKKEIYWSKINYQDIINILNNHFKYNFSISDVDKKDGSIYKLIKEERNTIQNLVNGYTKSIYYNNEKLNMVGKELIEKYKEYIYKNKKLY